GSWIWRSRCWRSKDILGNTPNPSQGGLASPSWRRIYTRAHRTFVLFLLESEDWVLVMAHVSRQPRPADESAGYDYKASLRRLSMDNLRLSLAGGVGKLTMCKLTMLWAIPVWPHPPPPSAASSRPTPPRPACSDSGHR